MDDIKTRTYALISEVLAVDEPKLNDGLSFIDDLGADSLDMIELAMCIEDTFGVTTDDDAMGRIETVGELIVLVRKAGAA